MTLLEIIDILKPHINEKKLMPSRAMEILNENKIPLSNLGPVFSYLFKEGLVVLEGRKIEDKQPPIFKNRQTFFPTPVSAPPARRKSKKKGS